MPLTEAALSPTRFSKTPSPILAKRRGKMREAAINTPTDENASPELTTRRSARPLSLMSDSSISVASPPPPYRRGLTMTPPDTKQQLGAAMFPPPPPDPLESGPSSVRTSLIELEQDDTVDTDEEAEEAGNTLTLRGLRRLLKQHELGEMASQVSLRLQTYQDSASMRPSIIEVLDHSPASSAPPSAQPSPERYTLPTDTNLAFAMPSSRTEEPAQAKAGQRLSLLRAEERAEEDDARIAALEQMLVEARESEETARKANVRLRRDNSKLRQQLEDTEDIVAEQLEHESWSRRRSEAEISDDSHVVTAMRPPSRATMTNDRIGWGATTFPEFPLRCVAAAAATEDDDVSEVASESTTRPRSSYVSPESVHSAVMDPRLALSDNLLAVKESMSSASSSSSSSGITPSEPGSEPPTVVIERAGARNRPAVSRDTFLSPVKQATGTPARAPPNPRLAIQAASRPSSTTKGSPSCSPTQSSFSSRVRCSPYPSPRMMSHSRNDSVSSAGTGPHRRTLSFGSSKTPFSAMTPSPASGVSEEGTPSRARDYSPGAGLSPMAAFASVRSYLSDYLTKGRRTLGSELGSNYSPSPERCRVSNCSCSEYDDEVQLEAPPPRSSTAASLAALAIGLAEAKLTGRISSFPQQGYYDQCSGSTEERAARRSAYRTPSFRHSSPAGTLMYPTHLSRSSAASDAYKAMHDSELRRIRWAPDAKMPREWSPHSWPSPTPTPRDMSIPLPNVGDDDISDIDSDGPHLFTDNLYDDVSSPAPAISLSAPTPGPVSRVASRTTARVVSLPPMPDRSESPAHLAPASDPWDEYSDRATPSPRLSALRPLFLLSTPAVHARSTSLSQVQHQYHHARELPYPLTATAAHGGLYYRRGTPVSPYMAAPPPAPTGPVTIPARAMHDFFCLILVLFDYLEWAIILMYRLFSDIRAGPSAAVAKPRAHAKRYYL